MRTIGDVLTEYGPAAVVLAGGMVLLSLLVADVSRADEARARYRDAACAGLYSLAATRADSLAIAKDGCAAYLGKGEE